MGRSDIQQILDGLDRRLALGEIDLGTYQSLKSKFATQLVETTEQPLEAAVEAMPVDAVALRCPGCMAPLPVPQDKFQTSVTCEYCGGSFALKIASEEMERLRDDVRRWISETATKAGTSSIIDEASRQFIFHNKIWPQLTVTVDRAVEFYQATRYMPLFTFPILANLESSPFNDALLLTPDITSLVDRLKSVVAQIQSPELAPFAINDREKSDLLALEVNCMEVVHFSNVRFSLAMFTTDGFERARTNLHAVGGLYSAAAETSAVVDAAYGKLMLAQSTRLSADEKAVEILAKLMSQSEGVLIEPMVIELENAARNCEKAASDIESSGREPKETAPASEGCRNDAQVIQMLADCTRIYSQCAVESGEGFASFLGMLELAIDKVKTPESDINWLKSFLSNLRRHMGAVVSEIEVPVVSDFSWVEPLAAASVRRSLFSGNETYDVKDRLLLPFWMAEMHFSEQKGSWIFKKGQSAKGLMFMDATKQIGTCFILLGDSQLAEQSLRACESPGVIGQSALAVMPIVSADIALKRMKTFIDGSEQYRGGFVKMVDIVYLPSAIVRYVNRKGERDEVFMPIIEMRSIPVSINRLKLGTQEIVLAS